MTNSQDSKEKHHGNRIHLIKDFEKIAAGEVIERPASVVKELVENSLDAGANSITVVISNYGKELIQVIDNGHGINENDIIKAFKAHTSSKIDSADDLMSLTTLGFRGEALNSIAAISKVEVVTKTNDSDIGTKCILEGGEIRSKSSVGSPVGTNIKVRDLFYNTPVRYKFLKTDRVEMGHITDIITRLILAYPEVHFKLVHNEIPVLNSPSTKKHENVIFDIYGKRIARNVEKFDIRDSKFEIWGFLGKPMLSRSTKSMSTVFINRRFVRSPLIEKAMDEAYRDYVMIHKHPFYIIFIDLEPDMVDFNIHPTKKIVKFEGEHFLLRRIISLMKNVVEDRFGSRAKVEVQRESNKQKSKSVSRSIPELVPETQIHDNSQKAKQFGGEASQSETSKREGESKCYSLRPDISTRGDGAELKTSIQDEETTLDTFYQLSEDEKKAADAETDRDSRQMVFNRQSWIKTSAFPNMKLINTAGQLNNLYFVFENQDGFFLLDQHAAAERINYEEQLRYYKQGGIAKQELLKPIIFEVPINEVDFLHSNLATLEKFGFSVGFIGGNSFAIRAFPAIFSSMDALDIIKDIFMEVIEIGRESSFGDEVEKIIKYIACHKSLRGGDTIRDPRKAKNLLKRLSKCNNPHHCAHGRPTILHFSWKWVDKEFHRRS